MKRLEVWMFAILGGMIGAALWNGGATIYAQRGAPHPQHPTPTPGPTPPPSIELILGDEAVMRLREEFVEKPEFEAEKARRAEIEGRVTAIDSRVNNMEKGRVRNVRSP